MTKTQEIVSALLSAREEKTPLSSLETEGFTGNHAFYSVQDEYIQRKLENQNDRIAGYKISLTNKGLQTVFQTDEPVYGTLTDETLVKEGVLSRSDFFDPLLEAELMFIVTEDISPFADPVEIIEKTMIAPGLEIPDSRIKNWYPKISIGELIMDNAVTGKVIAGRPIKVNSGTILDNISVTLYHNGEPAAEGKSSFVLENPLNAVLWLNNSLSSQGKSLQKGMIISSGTFISPIPLVIGTYRAVFDVYGEVELEVRE
ncbi:2-keto-4-pentenoate hydratase [Peribacillus deserti]|uniref:2-keto-4-pentenoate hydratase n=1 Tax=Peribacillus deserti TaxID=673318 RepID=A0ABS2QHY8_9BACI|nr:2-keto-4-pentenoate hydratase [Peribacillus deserti]MBM7692778.1 2-keto-4-pentenoate hydratase [Peribacillus deserti]